MKIAFTTYFTQLTYTYADCKIMDMSTYACTQQFYNMVPAPIIGFTGVNDSGRKEENERY